MQVPIQNNGQRPGNGSGAHHQNMGRVSLCRQILPLPDAKAMLLIRNHQGQGTVLHLFLNQRMGSDNQVCLAGSNQRTGFSFFPGIHGTRQEYRAENQPVLLYISQYGFIVLYSQYFRWRHQGSLISVCRRRQQGQYRYDGFAGAYVSLHQAVHAVRAVQVFLYLRPYLLLCFRQRKGKAFQKPGRVDCLRHPVAIFQLIAEHLVLPHKEQEGKEFVKYQPLSGPYHRFIVIREMDDFHRFPFRKQLIFFQ